MKSVGIDIGTYSVKVVEINTSKKGFAITQFFEKELPQNPGVDNQLEIIDFLRNLFSSYDLSQVSVAMTIRQDQVSHRLKTFPFADRLKILKSLPFELEEEIPFPTESAIFDGKVVKIQGHQSEVLACIAQKSKVAQYVQLAQDIGVSLSTLGAEGLSFANLYENWNQPIATEMLNLLTLDENEKPEINVSLSVNIGHTHTLVVVFENNRPIAVRSLLWGAKNVIDAIAKKYELPLLDAMKEFKTKAFILTHKQGASFDQVTFSDTISKSFRELTKDLQLTLLELKSQMNAVVKNIDLTGGGSLVQNLNAFMTQQLEVPVNRVNLLDQFPQVEFERNSRIDASFSLAIGIAIDTLRKPRNPAISFLKQEFALQNDGFKILWQRWGFVAQMTAVLLVMLMAYTHFRVSFSEEMIEQVDTALSEQARNVAKLPRRQANEGGVKKYIRENKKRVSELKTLASVAQLNSSVELLKRVSEQVPPFEKIQLDVQKFSVIDNEVKMEGYTASPKEVSILAKALESVSVGRVNVGPSRLPSKANRVSFAMDFKMDRGLQKAGNE